MLGRRVVGALLISVSAAVFIPPRIWSQTVSASPAWIKDVKLGEVVRLSLRVSGVTPPEWGDNHIAGPLRRLEPDYVVLGPLPGYSSVDTPVALAIVDSAWVLKPHGRRGLLIGTLIGGGFGFALASQTIRFCPPAPYQGGGSACVGNRVVGTLVGVAIGAPVGWLIGTSFVHWARRLP